MGGRCKDKTYLFLSSEPPILIEPGLVSTPSVLFVFLSSEYSANHFQWFDSSTRYLLEKELARPIFVAWSFGRIDMFRKAANTLLEESRSDENGEILDLKGQSMPEIMPPGIIGQSTCRP